MNLAQLIRKWRFALELDQKDAASIIGVEVKVLRALEAKGEVAPGNVGKIIAWLFSDGPAPNANGSTQEPLSPFVQQSIGAILDKQTDGEEKGNAANQD